MKKQEHFLETLLCLLIIIFFLGRIVFLTYNHHVDDFSLWDAISICKPGLLAHDFSVAVMLLAFPWLATLVATRFTRLPLRAILIPYYIVMGFLVGAVVIVDTIMYEFWQFKLNAVVLSYASHPEGATSSVSLWFIASRVLAVLLATLCVVVPCIRLTPKHIRPDYSIRYIRMSSIIWGFLIVASLFFTRLGDAYQTGKSLFLNHAAVNPVYAFCSSFYADKPFGDRHNYMD